MKVCNQCGARLSDDVKACTSCGTGDFSPVPEEPAPQFPIQEAEPACETAPAAEVKAPENIIAGIVGAFLFAIIGGALYFVVYQMGFIAGICGLATFALANFGYGLFAGTKNKASIPGLISAVVAAVLMVFAAEYLCVSYEIFLVYQEEFAITFFDAVQVTPEFLAEPELMQAVLGDLAFAYIFGAISVIGNIMNLIKGRKKA